jgi:hypothetical protein
VLGSPRFAFSDLRALYIGLTRAQQCTTGACAQSCSHGGGKAQARELVKGWVTQSFQDSRLASSNAFLEKCWSAYLAAMRMHTSKDACIPAPLTAVKNDGKPPPTAPAPAAIQTPCLSQKSDAVSLLRTLLPVLTQAAAAQHKTRGVAAQQRRQLLAPALHRTNQNSVHSG